MSTLFDQPETPDERKERLDDHMRFVKSERLDRQHRRERMEELIKMDRLSKKQKEYKGRGLLR